MLSPSLPPAFAVLAGHRNPAGDFALVQALPHLDASIQQPALELLLERAHPPSLAALVTAYHDHPRALRSLIVRHARRLSPGLRIAVDSSALEDRLAAIEIIVESRNADLADLLADALRQPCATTQKLAAAALHGMTAAWRARVSERASGEDVARLHAEAGHLAGAVRSAVHRWETHRQRPILEAALWLTDRVEPAIRKKLETRHTTLARALSQFLERTTDPSLAGSVVRAFGIPALQAAAGRALCRNHDTAFLRALFMESWLLADTRIAQGCRRVRNGRWVREAAGVIFELDDPAAACGVRFLSAVEPDDDCKIDLLRELVGAGGTGVRRAAVCVLILNRSEAAERLLTVIAARPGDDVARMAAREVRRRQARASVGRTVSGPATAPDTVVLLSAAFEHYWNSFDDLTSEEGAQAAAAIHDGVPDLRPRLQAKLALPRALDRARALRVTAALGMVKEVEEPIRRLSHDPDAVVRGVAVSLLPGLPGAPTLRVLRDRINDPDVRVQANAIEALDRLGREDRVACTVPKLESSDGRVRATAIRSLLRAEVPQAGEALLDMLDDSAPTHRLSALWVVESLRLSTVSGRIQTLSRTDPDARVRTRATQVQSLLVRDLPDGLSKLHPAAGMAEAPAGATPASVPLSGESREVRREGTEARTGYTPVVFVPYAPVGDSP